MKYNRPLFATLLAVGMAFPIPTIGQDTGTRRLSLENYMDMESVSNPQISPDGNQIIYARSWVDKLHDSRKSSLWIIDADGSRNRTLSEGSGARWSPDGTRIAYTHEGDPRGSQSFGRWMETQLKHAF